MYAYKIIEIQLYLSGHTNLYESVGQSVLNQNSSSIWYFDRDARNAREL